MDQNELSGTLPPRLFDALPALQFLEVSCVPVVSVA
jgi:hypothetical protein